MQIVMLYINNGSAEQLYDPTLSWESRRWKGLSAVVEYYIDVT